MIYERGDVITLSNGAKYVVVTTVSYEGKDYIYLINEDNNSDVMFCEYQGKEFEKVDNVKLIENLLKAIMPEMQQIVDEA